MKLRAALAAGLLLGPLARAQHILGINGKQFSFTNREIIDDTIHIHWSYAETQLRVHFGVQASIPENGWAAIGFSPHGLMLNSKAFVAASTNANATLTEYHITQKSLAGLVRPNASLALDKLVEFAPDRKSVSFVFTLDALEAQLSIGNNEKTGVIYAVGPATSAGLGMHTKRAGGSLTLNSQSENGVSVSLNLAWRENMIRLHAALMVIGWLVLMPLGSFFASPHFRKMLFGWDVSSNPRHTNAHVLVMVVAMLLVSVGYVVGYGFIGTRSFFVHLAVGSTALALVILQGFLGVWRRSISPLNRGALGRKWKHLISTAHAINGRLLWKLATINVVHGLGIYTGFGYTTYIFVLAVIGYGVVMLLLGPIKGLAKRFSARNAPDNNDVKLKDLAG